MMAGFRRGSPRRAARRRCGPCRSPGARQGAREFKGHSIAFCEVAQMLTDRLGLPASMQGLFAHLIERWDGKGLPGRARHEEIPLPVRIASVARDAAFQRLLGGPEFAAQVVRGRAGARSTRPWPSRSPTRPRSSWPATPAGPSGRRRSPASLARG